MDTRALLSLKKQVEAGRIIAQKDSVSAKRAFSGKFQTKVILA